MKTRFAFFAVLLLLFAALQANEMADGLANEMADETAWDERRYMNLLSELRCLVCQNQSLADSHAGLAGDLRDHVRRMILGGADDDEIKRFMTERYGDFVLYDPPVAPRTYMLWGAPFILLAMVVFFVFRYVLRRPPSQA